MYMLILGLDVIGNPVGLLLGIGEGVTDLFYEPFQGAIQGPEEFAEGLALGVKSLFGHAIGKTILFYDWMIVDDSFLYKTPALF